MGGPGQPAAAAAAVGGTLLLLLLVLAVLVAATTVSATAITATASVGVSSSSTLPGTAVDAGAVATPLVAATASPRAAGPLPLSGGGLRPGGRPPPLSAAQLLPPLADAVGVANAPAAADVSALLTEGSVSSSVPFAAASAAAAAATHSLSSLSSCAPRDESKDHPSELLEIAAWNCARVNAASSEFESIIAWQSAAAQQSWNDRVKQARTLCDQMAGADALTQCSLALEAWGTVLMQGRECCNVLGPPFCVSTLYSKAGHFLPFLVMVVLCFFVLLTPCLCPKSVQGPSHFVCESPGATVENVAPVAAAVGGAAEGQRPLPRLFVKLEGLWLQGSSLRMLPHATDFARSTASLFAALQATFGFQEESAQNQFEHLLSLWRSHVSVVADRAFAGGGRQSARRPCGGGSGRVVVDEASLLLLSFVELHADLLNGLEHWKTRLYACEAAGHGGDDGKEMHPLGGADWQAVQGPAAGSKPLGLARALAETAAFLLVWGEAGNLRFMPEIVCFLTELVLRADAPEGGRSLYSQPLNAHSGPFLVKIVRPIYNVIFNENYKCVEVDPRSRRDDKKLREGFAKFLPADCTNYDDWNELFCDPKRLARALVLSDGSRLFDAPPGKRFAALASVDWTKSLSGAKSHRELHSIWGVFAATHRLWFFHALMYLVTLWYISSRKLEETGTRSRTPLAGATHGVCLATTFLIVPLHAFCWKLSRWFVAGTGLRRRLCGPRNCCACLLQILSYFLHITLWCIPVITYTAVRVIEFSGDKFKSPENALWYAEGFHFFVSACGAMIILFVPSHAEDVLWPLTPTPWVVRLVRNTFWVCVFAVKLFTGLQIVDALDNAVANLAICRPGLEDIGELQDFAFSPSWDKDFLVWMGIWTTGFVLYTADTQFWVVIGCTVLGVLTALYQRHWRIDRLTCEDAVAQIPGRFSEKVLVYDGAGSLGGVETAGSSRSLSSRPRGRSSRARLAGSSSGGGGERGELPCSPSFPAIWDRIVEFLRYEDKIDDIMAGNLFFDLNQGHQPQSGERVDYAYLQRRLFREGETRLRIPHIFMRGGLTAPERCLRRDLGILADPSWPLNPEVQWRLNALSRALTLDMPRPFRAPYIPGFTVLIPHYFESILMTKGELYRENPAEEEIVPLMSWLAKRFDEEFRSFTSRMQANSTCKHIQWPQAGSEWGAYGDEEWEKIAAWASMRNQTLWRTVAGMTLYHLALDCHNQVQREANSKLSSSEVWDASELFTCMVSMQTYAFFNDEQYKHTNKMLDKFPKSLKIAYIDIEDKGLDAELDNVHPRQQRRYYSCLVDKSCPVGLDGRRRPRLRVELPGYPILGDGKGDNQNHAIPFTRGSIIQVIDANQGAYFEQMLLLPCVLGEFRPPTGTTGLRRRIVGFPEHITSDIGTIGDFAAGAETAFGTLLQRSYSVLGARMHYGHPDMFNKIAMMQQGGISKATKTVHLSEDIFAGMDFTLRGGDRNIKHAEYFHLAKGRDLGFNTVLTFFSKLSAGTGEQLLTRQMLRLGHVLGLGEFFMLYYAHGGFYLAQFLMSSSVPLLVFLWLLIVLDDPEEKFKGTSSTHMERTDITATMLQQGFSWLIGVFIVAQTMPLFMEVWFQAGFFMAIKRIIGQMVTLAPLHFVFQAKIIGIYVSNEIRFGGAAYIPTGRGLPTDRKPFIGYAHYLPKRPQESGLYNDWAQHAFYDGFRLLLSFLIVVCAGGVTVKGGNIRDSLDFWIFSVILTIVSWLYSPFIFNPYQFANRYFLSDLADWRHLFFDDQGTHWVYWYTSTQLKPESGLRASVLDVLGWALFVGCWYTVLNQKMHILTVVLSGSTEVLFTQTGALLPPVFLSGTVCLVVPGLLCCASRQPVHPAIIAGLVAFCTFGEGIFGLRKLMLIAWWKSFSAGLILKYSMLSLALILAETYFRLKGSMLEGSAAGRYVAEALKLWLYGHRMAFDLIISTFLFWSLSPMVFFDRMRSVCCKGCSVHQLLIFRDPGHLQRDEAQVLIEGLSYTPGSSFGPRREGGGGGASLQHVLGDHRSTQPSGAEPR